MKKAIIISAIISFTFILTYCNQDNVSSDEDCDYTNCNTTEPFDGNLQIKLTVKDTTKPVPVSVYKGKFEDNVVETSFLSKREDVLVFLPLNQYYTVAATYIIGNDTIVAINGDNFKKTDRAVCDSTCWIISGGRIDVRLGSTNIKTIQK